MFTSNGFISCFCLDFKFRNESPEDGSSALIATSDSSLRSAPAILFSCWLLGLGARWGEDGDSITGEADHADRGERQTLYGRQQRFFGKETEWW